MYRLSTAQMYVCTVCTSSAILTA